jgi:Uracil DNA glycosylase superfamily
MKKELNQLNFNKLLLLDSSINLDIYDFNTYLKNNQHIVKGYCLLCEKRGCSTCPTDNTFELKNISHGASTDDILLATKQNAIDLSEWHTEGVLFLMEGPSKDYDIYEEVEFNGYKKRPTTLWYWVHEEQKSYSYPEEFQGRKYGTLFNSIIFTFKLRNAYLTNLIKCGLNNLDDKYKPIGDYNPESIKTCYENFLKKEIEIINPKVIFCFGSKVYNFLWTQYSNDLFPWVVISLPHPARGRSGFLPDLFRHSYYSMILEGLYESGIITINEAEKKYGEFLELSIRDNG